MNKISVSVIVPVYKTEMYIKRCMDSLINQSFEDYEIVIVNDGTPDNSMDYVLGLQTLTDKIVICNRQNGGLSAARNTGINEARGEYLLFVDSDDAIKENCLSMLYEEAHFQDIDLLLFDSYTIPESIEYFGNSGTIRRNLGISSKVMTGIELMGELIDKGGYGASACSYLVRKRLLGENGLRFYEGILHEDELFTPLVFASAKRALYHNWLIYKRYVHAGSIMTNGNYKKRMEGLAVVIKELTIFGNEKLNVKADRDIFESNIISITKNFLGETTKFEVLGNTLENNVREIRQIVKRKHWKLGLKFYLYILRLKIQKKMGI